MLRRHPDGSPLLRADIPELMTGLNGATLVLNEAWRRWDLRGVSHLPIPPDSA
jgi:hypothetical protein